MRLLVWNCYRSLARGLPAVCDLGADLAVLSEAPAALPDPSLFEGQTAWVWHGLMDARRPLGVGIAAFDGSLLMEPAADPAARWSVAARHSSGLRILGVWTCPEAGKKNYGEHALNAVTARRDWLQGGPGIVAGDFNLVAGGEQDRATGAFGHLVEELGELGYTSVYHHITGEPFGAEAQPTFYRQWQRELGFHIDYCFMSHDLVPFVEAVQVGSHDDWVARKEASSGLSDHVPLIVDLSDRADLTSTGRGPGSLMTQWPSSKPWPT